MLLAVELLVKFHRLWKDGFQGNNLGRLQKLNGFVVLYLVLFPSSPRKGERLIITLFKAGKKKNFDLFSFKSFQRRSCRYRSDLKHDLLIVKPKLLFFGFSSLKNFKCFKEKQLLPCSSCNLRFSLERSCLEKTHPR